jgi:hypothetical protein
MFFKLRRCHICEWYRFNRFSIFLGRQTPVAPLVLQSASYRSLFGFQSARDNLYVEFPVPGPVEFAKVNPLPGTKQEFSVLNYYGAGGAHERNL